MLKSALLVVFFFTLLLFIGCGDSGESKPASSVDELEQFLKENPDIDAGEDSAGEDTEDSGE